MRVCSGSKPKYDKPLKHDDIVIVPEFFCKEDDWSLYYKLIDEMRESQQRGKAPGSRGPGPEWQSWHEGAHLISKDPSGSKTYQAVWKSSPRHRQASRRWRATTRRNISISTQVPGGPEENGRLLRPPAAIERHALQLVQQPERLEALPPRLGGVQRAARANQNCTVGVSFGDARELAFVDAMDPSKRFYFPQTNGGLFYFGSDVNIRFAAWKMNRRS